jgi:hypothetical protein
MNSIKEKFIVDEEGNKTEVILSIDDYRILLEKLEELEELSIYDKIKSSPQEILPFDDAMKEIGL